MLSMTDPKTAKRATLRYELTGTRIATHDAVQDLPGGWKGNLDGGDCTPTPYAKPRTTKIPRLHPFILRHTQCKGIDVDHSDPTGEHACKCFTCLEIIDELYGDMVKSPPYLVRYGMLGDMGVNLGAVSPGHYGFRIQHPNPVFLHTPVEGAEDNIIHYGHPRDSWVQVQIPPGSHYFLSRSLAYETYEVAQFSATSGDIILYVWANQETRPMFNIDEMSPQRWYTTLLRVKWINIMIEDGEVHEDSDDEMDSLNK